MIRSGVASALCLALGAILMRTYHVRYAPWSAAMRWGGAFGAVGAASAGLLAWIVAGGDDLLKPGGANVLLGGLVAAAVLPAVLLVYSLATGRPEPTVAVVVIALGLSGLWLIDQARRRARLRQEPTIANFPSRYPAFLRAIVKNDPREVAEEARRFQKSGGAGIIPLLEAWPRYKSSYEALVQAGFGGSVDWGRFVQESAFESPEDLRIAAAYAVRFKTMDPARQDDFMNCLCSFGDGAKIDRALSVFKRQGIAPETLRVLGKPLADCRRRPIAFYYDNLSAFHGNGERLWLTRDGLLVAQIATQENGKGSDLYYRRRLSAAQLAEWLDRLASADLLSSQAASRSGIPDEVSVTMAYRDAQGRLQIMTAWDQDLAAGAPMEGAPSGGKAHPSPRAFALRDVALSLIRYLSTLAPERSRTLSPRDRLIVEDWPENIEKLP